MKVSDLNFKFQNLRVNLSKICDCEIHKIVQYQNSNFYLVSNYHLLMSLPLFFRQRVYRAMYDYQAQDLDEVSFCDGDLIVNCTAIDEGWMTGLVQRTGRHGMLPANYVEPVQI